MHSPTSPLALCRELDAMKIAPSDLLQLCVCVCVSGSRCNHDCMQGVQFQEFYRIHNKIMAGAKSRKIQPPTGKGQLSLGQWPFPHHTVLPIQTMCQPHYAPLTAN